MRKLVFPTFMSLVLSLAASLSVDAAGWNFWATSPAQIQAVGSGTERACHKSEVVLPHGTRLWRVTTCVDWSYDDGWVTHVSEPRVECWSLNRDCSGSTSSVVRHGQSAIVTTRTEIKNRFLWWIVGFRVIPHDFVLYGNGKWVNKTPYPY